MPPLNIGSLRAVSKRLDQTGFKYAFTGGSIVNLLLDDPELSPARPTDDVDVIVEIVSEMRYSDAEDVFRKLGFEHDTRTGAPICRWRLSELIVDIMPTRGEPLGLNTQWFKEVLEYALVIDYAKTKLKVVSPVGFLVTKYLTFSERGEGDYYNSHDLEDFITVIDGRENIVSEVNSAPMHLREYLIEGIAKLLKTPSFIEALPAYLPFDSASQQRLPFLKAKLEEIAKLKLG